MMDCRHRSGLHGRTCLNGASIVIHNCSQHQICTIDPSELLNRSGLPVAACTTCPERDAGEPVGEILSGILSECGITRKACLPCQDWVAKMNRWGIAGCEHHRAEILERLNEAAGEATWAEWGTVAWGGYGSTNAILNEALKRARTRIQAGQAAVDRGRGGRGSSVAGCEGSSLPGELLDAMVDQAGQPSDKGTE